MNYLKSLFKPTAFLLNLEILLVVIFSLFFLVSPLVLVTGDPFLFGAKNESLGLYFPLIGFVFLGITLLKFFTKSLSKPSTETLAGIGLILLAVVVNGYFSDEPEFNFYLLGWIGFCSLACFWKPLALKPDFLALIMLIGLIIGTVNALDQIDLMNHVAAGWVLWFWFFAQQKTPNQKIIFLLTVGFCISFGYWLLGLVVLLAGIFEWWKRKKLYRRKAAGWWWIIFSFLLVGVVISSFMVLPNLSLPNFLSLYGVGIYQSLPILTENSSSVAADLSMLKDTWSALIFEWGILLSLLGLGFCFLWKSQKAKICLWALFLAILTTVPNIINQPIFWLLIAFFTFNLNRLDQEI